MRVVHFLLDLLPVILIWSALMDHNVVHGIEIWRKAGLVFADQQAGHFGARRPAPIFASTQTTERPLSGFSFFSLGYVRPHRNSHTFPCKDKI